MERIPDFIWARSGIMTLHYGNANYYESFNTYGWNYTFQSDGWGTPFWWNKMLTDPYFVNMLYCRWHEFRQGVLSDESILARIDSAVSVIGAAAGQELCAVADPGSMGMAKLLCRIHL